MNDDALAAVIAAAHVLLARRAHERAPAPDSSGWKVAARLPIHDAAQGRVISRARSRWALSGRLRD